MRLTRNGDWRALPGRNSRDTHVFLLVGPRFDGEGPPTEAAYDPASPDHRNFDEYDYKRVMALPWRYIRGDGIVNVTPSDDDAAFIAAARTAVPALIAEIRRLRAAAQRPTFTPGGEVIV